MRHFFFNAKPAPDLRFRFALTPCGSALTYFENLAGIAMDAGGRAHIPWLQLVLLMHDHGLELATMPRPVWLGVARLAAPLARLLGYRSTWPEYESAGGRV